MRQIVTQILHFTTAEVSAAAEVEKIQWNLRPAMFILYKEGKESRLPDGPARAALCIERRALF